MKIKNLDIKPKLITTADGLRMEVVDYPALLKLDADVYLIFGMRSFGKSYGILEYVLNNWIRTGDQFAVMRTIDDDVLQSKIRKYLSGIKPWFDSQMHNEKELYVWNSEITARSLGSDKKVLHERIGSALSLSGWLKYKSENYDRVTTVIFEEFLEKKPKLSAESMLDGFLNNLSTIIRLRQNVKVFCLANTVRKKSPIFEYYGINFGKVKQGIPTLFSEDNGLKVCVYYTPNVKLDAASTKHYTVSQTRQAKMIVSGQWESGDYMTSWNGYSFPDILYIRRFRSGYGIFITDLQIYVKMCGVDYPVLITTQKIRYLIAASLTELWTFHRNIYDFLLKKIITGSVIVEAGTEAAADAIKERTF